MHKNTPGSLRLWAVLTPFLALLTAAALIATHLAFGSAQAINIFLKTQPYRVERGEGGDTVRFETGFASAAELEAHDRVVAEQLAGEGAVLLCNNGALPLSAGARISAVGRSAANIVTCGTGAADIDTSNAPTLRQALEDEGFAVNPTLWDFYETGAGSAYIRTPGKLANQTEGGGRADFTVAEVPQAVYTAAVRSSFAQYRDAAVVVISRVAGEGSDLAADGFVDGTNILELTREEKDMLAMVHDNFDTIVVVINATNPLQCGFLTDPAYGIDAAVWIGYTGTWGLNALAGILSGRVNPSGRLVDTYCYDALSAPAVVGLYGHTFTNYTPEDPRFYQVAGGQLDGNCRYITYQEGIYVGYRYYETRYEDAVMGTGNAGDYDYASTVAYPFGFGLSYTSFEWSGCSWSYRSGSDSFELTLTVRNTGSCAGKEVVQVYFQSPYTEYDRQNGIEKAAVELCGFAKTRLLAPGDSEQVTVTVPRAELACYDRIGARTYILDAGDYYLTAARNAHDAVNSILTAKGYTVDDGMTGEGRGDLVFAYHVNALDSKTYARSAATGYPITNRFDSAELSGYGVPISYLSRSDWQGTWPEPIALEATEQMFADGLGIYRTYQGIAGSDTEYPVMGAEHGLTLGMMIGADYDDPAWEDLLDQATFEEMAALIGKGYHNTAAMPSVGKPATLDDNGPQGFTQALTGVKTCHCAYSDENTMAATFNLELMEEVGKCIGGDALDLGAAGLYGPAMNLHRNAYAGRNFEYYSEDGFLSGAIAAAEVRGIQSKGVYVYLKHFVLNDSETGCRCISTWCNEQAIRELYLKPFEMAVVQGGAWNVMNSFARLGVVWSGAHYGLQTEVLRGEWGLMGFNLTDFSGNSMFAQFGISMQSFDVAHGLLAGTDIWDSSSEQWSDDLLRLYRDDPDIAQAMRRATHRILYTVANSCGMNGLSSADRIVAVTPWWQSALTALDAALALATLGCGAMLVQALVRRGRERDSA